MGGLNWSEGLKAGAVGLNIVAQNKRQETDLLYKQLSQANMQRFQQQQAAEDREWRSEESKANRDWRGEESGAERESRELIAENKLLADKERAKITDAHNKVLEGQGDTRNIIAQQQADTSADRAVTSAQIAATKPYTERIGDLQTQLDKGSLMMSEPEKKAITDQISVLQGKSQKAHEEAGLNRDELSIYRGLTNKGFPHETAFAYSQYPDDERKKIDTLAKEEEARGLDAKTAKRSAIGKYRSMSGNVPEFVPPAGEGSITPEVGEISTEQVDVKAPVVEPEVKTPAVEKPVTLPTTPEDTAAVEKSFLPSTEKAGYTGAMGTAVAKKQVIKAAEKAMSKITTAKEMKAFLGQLQATKEQKDQLIQKWYADREGKAAAQAVAEKNAQKSRDKAKKLRDYNTQT